MKWRNVTGNLLLSSCFIWGVFRGLMRLKYPVFHMKLFICCINWTWIFEHELPSDGEGALCVSRPPQSCPRQHCWEGCHQGGASEPPGVPWLLQPGGGEGAVHSGSAGATYSQPQGRGGGGDGEKDRDWTWGDTVPTRDQKHAGAIWQVSDSVLLFKLFCSLSVEENKRLS